MYDKQKYAKRTLVQLMAEQGWKASKIKKTFRLDKNFVYRWYKKYNDQLSIDDEPRSGRPRTYSDAKEKKIADFALKHSGMSYQELARELHLAQLW